MECNVHSKIQSHAGKLWFLEKRNFNLSHGTVQQNLPKPMLCGPCTVQALCILTYFSYLRILIQKIYSFNHCHNVKNSCHFNVRKACILVESCDGSDLRRINSDQYRTKLYLNFNFYLILFSEYTFSCLCFSNVSKLLHLKIFDPRFEFSTQKFNDKFLYS